MNNIVINSAKANEIQTPFPPRGYDKMTANEIGKRKPSSNEMTVDNLFSCIA